MKTVFDASCLINLIHGQVLEAILQISNMTFYLGEMVKEECAPYQDIISNACSKRTLHLLDDNSLSASAFIQLQEKYMLGEGETECLAFCQTTTFCMASDDRKARIACENLYGAARVTGTLGLLKRAVDNKVLSPNDAFNAYISMKEQGAFLPSVKKEYFDSAVELLTPE